ncbi:MAG TPA: exodeoxyribonuclease VII large subunit, partial [Hyphomicrobium sp.]|nr:exodeoxyribonuclease VII large subunit [Hyphomicrobium sp.]
LLGSLGYQSVLARGFALVRDADGAMVRAAAAVTAGQTLEIEFADGRIKADAREGGGGRTAQSEPPSTAPAPPAAPQNKVPRGGQGSLF